MRADASFTVPVKLWALLCVFAGVTIGGNVLLTSILTGGALFISSYSGTSALPRPMAAFICCWRCCCTVSASTGCACRSFRSFMF